MIPTPISEEANDDDHETSDQVTTEPHRSTRVRSTPEWYNNCGTPAQRKPERLVFQPRDRGEVFWNTALLSIEQTSFLLLHEYEYKFFDITMSNIGTTTLRHP